MGKFNAEHAAVLAATEILPADWGDLSALLQASGGPASLLSGTVSLEGRDGPLLEYLRTSIDPARLRHWLARLDLLEREHPDVDLVILGDVNYPRNLSLVAGCPPFLFVRGGLRPGDGRAVAIVGSRVVDKGALELAERMANAMASHGVTVVSGLAVGVDAAAHRGALSCAGGRTIAAVAVGIDMPLNRDGARELAPLVARHGAVLSRFRPGSPATRSAFLTRNAVISGLALASVLIHASEYSGTRSEADRALDQGRPVLLWGPTLRRDLWARQYAQRPGVSIVDTFEEILHVIDDAERGFDDGRYRGTVAV